MKLGLVKLLLASALIAFLAGCGGSSSGGVSKTSKTIKGVALKADGSAFTSGATVLAVDQNGNVADGAVDANGNYSVTLTGVASSGKKGKLVEGNSFIRISEGSSTIDLVIAEEQTKVNANAITSAASLVALGEDVDLDEVFEEAENASKKSQKTVSSPAILAALAKVQKLTEKLFKANASLVAGALFGFGENGSDVFDVDKLIDGTAKEEEVYLIKAAASTVTGNLVAAAVSAANDPLHTTFLLNTESFFEALAGELAGADGAAKDNAFSNFLNNVLTDSSVKAALNEIKDALNELVVLLETEPGTKLQVAIPETVTGAPTVTISVERDDDTISYKVEGGKAGDTTIATMTIFSGSDVEAVIAVPLTFDGTDFVVSTAAITVTTGSVVVSVKNTESVGDGKVDLAKALDEAEAALIAAKEDGLAAKIPDSTAGYDIVVSGTAVSRSGVDAVNTYIKANGESVNSLAGVTLK